MIHAELIREMVDSGWYLFTMDGKYLTRRKQSNAKLKNVDVNNLDWSPGRIWVNRGYPTITYRNHHMYFHHAIYIVFIGQIPDGYDVDHIDGNVMNSSADNLRLVKKEDCVRYNRYGENYRNRICKKSKYDDKLESVMIDRNNGVTYRDISNKYGINIRAVHFIIKVLSVRKGASCGR